MLGLKVSLLPLQEQPMTFTLFLTIIFSTNLTYIKKEIYCQYMLEKTEILFVIVFLLLAFYFVIFFGARSKNKNSQNPKITKYLFGVRILIIIIAVVALILWSFL